MQQIKFLYGKNLNDSVSFQPGFIYLDLETGELFYDAPDSSITQHKKIIDSATLIYTITDTITFPSSESGEDDLTAKLGVAVLGSMVLGTE